MAEKKKKDLTWQHALIFIALGLSAASAWKLFMPKRQLQQQNNDTVNQTRQNNDAAEMQQYLQHLQSLPQVPVNQGSQMPIVATAPYYPQNFSQGPAVSSHQEEMVRNEQLQKIPIQEQFGINQMFPQHQQMVSSNRNTINPYSIPSAPQHRQTTHFDRITTGFSAEDVAKPSLTQQEGLQRQSGYSQATGYSTNPYTTGNVI